MWKKYFLCFAMLGGLLDNSGFAAVKEIAITIDDLPFVGSANGNSGKLDREHNRFLQMLQILIDKNIPATGFVIAGSIEKGQWALLEQFQQAGFILGNHTYTHRSLDSVSAEKYIADVDRADKVLAPLMGTQKYFRYPYLAEGRGQKRQQVYDYLANNQYVIAPVTIDSKDFLFNQQLFSIPYRLREKNIDRIKQRYLAYIWKQTLRAESSDQDKPIKQILLIHANLLNSHCLGDIIDLYQQNGYRFISLDEALKGVSPSTITTPVELPEEEALGLNFLR